MSGVKQIGGSIDDFLSRVRRAFEESFNKNKQPEQWLWVRDVFEHHVIAREKDQHWQIGMQVSADAVTFDARPQWKKVTLDYVAQMDGDQRGPVHEVMITEFKGQVPDVPVRTAVDLAEMTKGDDDPMYLTLEISRSGQESRSGLLHDDPLGESIAEQINTQAATGIMGHLKDSERGSAYPVPDIYWIGAIRQGGSTWAKGYIPKTKLTVREHYRVMKAAGGKAATSIYGAAVRELVDQKRGTYRLKQFKLEQLDLAPIERAALPLDGQWTITAQMGADMEEPQMTKEELLAQLTAAEIPDAVREQIVREWQASQGEADRVKQMETQIAEMQQQLTAYRVAEFEDGLNGKIADLVKFETPTDAAKQKLAALRQITRRAVIAEIGGAQDLIKAEAALTAYVGSDEYKALAAAVVAELAGPGARVGGKARGEGLKDTPEARREARSKFGFQA